MSYFMISIDAAVLSDSPPESKVTPLPTSATNGRRSGRPARRPRAARAPSGGDSSTIRRGSSALPRATPSIPPMPARASAVRPSTRHA